MVYMLEVYLIYLKNNRNLMKVDIYIFFLADSLTVRNIKLCGHMTYVITDSLYQITLIET